jgi:hypothetical protein
VFLFIAEFFCFVFVLFEGSKCELNRRSLAFKGIMATGVSVMASTLTSQAQPSQG